MPAGSLTLNCPAKVNLALAVGKPEASDPRGLHPIASWMVAVGFGDQLKLERIDSTDATPPASVFSLRFAEDAPAPQAIDWPLENDLAFRAHRLVEARAGRVLPVKAVLEKRIPAGAGLGGGSSDAAAMVVGLDKLFGLGLNDSDFSAVATELGSDVHFAIVALLGQASALVTGYGDQIEPIPIQKPLDLVLVFPPFGCPTGPVYAAWDRLNLSNPGHVFRDQAVRALAAKPFSSDAYLFNDLEAAAVAVEARLGVTLETLRNTLGLPAHVTGSGAACFVPADDQRAAEQTAELIQTQTGITAVATRTLG